MYGAPVDYSFKCIGTITDVLSEEPNTGVRPLRKNLEGKYSSQALRLNNNMIVELTGLADVLSAVFVEPTRLAWLDLSFNDITHIHSVYPANNRLLTVLTELVELRLLYLHGNSICNLSEVNKLGTLPLLHTITLHGNTIENEHSYRGYVISAIPHLKMMDFSAITKQERVIASIWHKGKKSCGSSNCC